MDSMIIGRYLPLNSFIHKRDPRLKIGLLLLFLIAVFFDAGFIGYGILAAYVILCLILSKISFKDVMKAMKPMIVMMLFLALFNPLFLNTGSVVCTLGPVKIYSGALKQTAYILIRLVLIISMTTLLTACTKPLDLTLGLEKLFGPLKKVGFPTHEIAMMISIALRFIPTLLEETQRIMKEQASRGVDFQEGTFKEKVSAIVSLIIPLFISAFMLADDLANAIESRNYNPEATRTRYHQVKWNLGDTLSLVFSLVVISSVIVLSFIL